MKKYRETKYLDPQKKFFDKLDNLSFSLLLKVFLIIITIGYFSIIVRLIEYGIPFSLINFNDIILYSQVYIFYIFFGTLSVSILVLFLSFISLTYLKSIMIKLFSLKGMLIFLIGYFVVYSLSKSLILYLLIIISIIYIFYDLIINFKIRTKYIKLSLVFSIAIILFICMIEVLNYASYDLRLLSNSKSQIYKRFLNETLITDIIDNYILEKEEPMIAKIKIKDTNETKTVLALGMTDYYLYYYSKNVITEEILKSFSEVEYNKICKEDKDIYYPSRIIKLLKTGKLKDYKYQKKYMSNIQIITLYKSFYTEFCKNEKKDKGE